MPRIRRWLGWMLAAFVVLALLGGIAAAGVYYAVSSKLPDVESLRHVELQEPMRVYSSDGKLMAVYGETRRYPVQIEDVPERLKQAFLATEDARFYEHGGIDYKGIARAVWMLATTDAQRVPGGSTITQQVARQFFLSSEYSYTRKLAEILLAKRIESELSKDEILELYLNKIFFGNRAYGIGAAAEFYYGKKLNELSLDEMASLAGIPKFPSSGNPISNPERAQQRRDNYVLQRMADLGFVTQAEADAAKAVPMHAAPHEPPVEAHAPYVAEMVRQEMIAQYGGDVLDKGYHVTTTIDSALQNQADLAVRDGLLLYDHRHGWHGVERHFDVAASDDAKALAHHLAGISEQAGLIPVVVAATRADGGVDVIRADGSSLSLPSKATGWTNRSPASLLKRGDLTRIRAGEGQNEWIIDQVPRAQSALVSLDASSGALKAMVGGFSYAGNKFNRAIQARRQPGSSFKPFVYASAMDKGFNPASIVLDAPVVFRDRRGHTWSPQNDDGEFRGPMRLREALVQSRNLVSVRLLDAVGVDYARKYITQFGFDEAELPPNLSMALGSASLTPLSIARGYAVFANGGSRVDTWIIEKVTDRNNEVVFQANPAIACRDCAGHATGSSAAPTQQIVDGFNFGAPAPAPAAANTETAAAEPAAAPDTSASSNGDAPKVAPRAIDPRTAYQMVSMMRDVVQRGTGSRARVIGREDVGGKTGSTNDHRDAWFSGFGGPYATTVWVGRDNYQSLGRGEYGGKAALPIWVDYMKGALKGQPLAANTPPQGMTLTEFNGASEWIKDEDLDSLQQEQLEIPQQDEKAFDIF